MKIVDLATIDNIRQVYGFPGYWISSDGRVFSTRTRNGFHRTGGKARELVVFMNGYMKVTFQRDGIACPMGLHVVLLETFVGPRPSPAHEGRHLDGNVRNNSLDNLAWGTPKENCDDRERHGRQTKGSAHKLSKLVEKQVMEIRSLYRNGSSIASLARRFDVTPGNIDFIVKGKTWVHLTERQSNGNGSPTGTTETAPAETIPAASERQDIYAETHV